MATTMLSITTPKYSKPEGYELTTVAKPAVAQPTDVLIRVRAASINPIDVKKADGLMKMAVQDTYVDLMHTILALATNVQAGFHTRSVTMLPAWWWKWAAVSRHSRQATRCMYACQSLTEVCVFCTRCMTWQDSDADVAW